MKTKIENIKNKIKCLKKIEKNSIYFDSSLCKEILKLEHRLKEEIENELFLLKINKFLSLNY